MENVSIFQIITFALPLVIALATAHLRYYIRSQMADLKMAILEEIEKRVEKSVSGFMPSPLLEEKLGAMRTQIAALDQRILSNQQAIASNQKSIESARRSSSARE